MIELIGVPFDGYGRPGHQARESAALRAAALAFPCSSDDTGDLDLPPGDPTRRTFVNEDAGRPADTGREAVQHLSRNSDGWWLHVDLDVLDPRGFPAQGLPVVPDDPGGLTWEQLIELARAAAGDGGLVGASIAIYDPDQDADGSCARDVVAAVSAVAGGQAC